jgi:hypothetical protein
MNANTGMYNDAALRPGLYQSGFDPRQFLRLNTNEEGKAERFAPGDPGSPAGSTDSAAPAIFQGDSCTGRTTAAGPSEAGHDGTAAGRICSTARHRTAAPGAPQRGGGHENAAGVGKELPDHRRYPHWEDAERGGHDRPRRAGLVSEKIQRQRFQAASRGSDPHGSCHGTGRIMAVCEVKSYGGALSG